VVIRAAGRRVVVGAFATVTVAEPLIEVPVTVATTWNVPVEPGAVYCPLWSTVPPFDSWTDQVTDVVVVPTTVAAKVIDSRGRSSALDGPTSTPEDGAAPSAPEPLQAREAAARAARNEARYGRRG
jgi:hypothetical protein